MAEIVLAVVGIRETAASLDKTEKEIDLALQRAMNRTADMTRTHVSRMIREKVNLTAGDLSPSGKRLFVAQRASAKAGGSMEIRITGRGSPTSLARFAGNQKRPKVRVKRAGIARYIPGTFIINLKNGNRGLAMRSEEKPAGAYKPKRMRNGLWLLYGPSIDQILRQPGIAGSNTSFEDVEPWVAEKLEAEFWRLLNAEID